MHPKDADGMANNVDPDQTASSAVCSWSALFAETYLSQYIEFVRYAPTSAQLHVYVYKVHYRETAALRTKSASLHATSNHVQSYALSVLKLHVLKCKCNFGSPSTHM